MSAQPVSVLPSIITNEVIDLANAKLGTAIEHVHFAEHTQSAIVRIMAGLKEGLERLPDG